MHHIVYSHGVYVVMVYSYSVYIMCIVRDPIPVFGR